MWYEGNHGSETLANGAPCFKSPLMLKQVKGDLKWFPVFQVTPHVRHMRGDLKHWGPFCKDHKPQLPSDSVVGVCELRAPFQYKYSWVCHYDAVQYNTILQTTLQYWGSTESRIYTHKRHPIRCLHGQLWGVCREDFRKKLTAPRCMLYHQYRN